MATRRRNVCSAAMRGRLALFSLVQEQHYSFRFHSPIRNRSQTICTLNPHIIVAWQASGDALVLCVHAGGHESARPSHSNSSCAFFVCHCVVVSFSREHTTPQEQQTHDARAPHESSAPRPQPSGVAPCIVCKACTRVYGFGTLED